MQPRIAGRLKAAPACALGHPGPSRTLDGYPRPHRVPVGSCTLQMKRQEVPGLRLVVNVGQGLVLRDHQHVDPTIVVQIARGQPAAHPQGLKRSAGGGRDVGQSRVGTPLVPEKLDGHLPGELRPAIVDVAIGGHQVEPTVVVGVQKSDPEAEQVARRRRQADGRGAIGEQPMSQVPKKRC